MRAVVVIVVIMVVLGLVGWLQFSSPNGDPSLRMDTEKIKQDTSEMVEKVKDVVEGTAENVDARIDREPLE